MLDYAIGQFKRQRVFLIQESDVGDSGALHGRAPSAIRESQVNFDHLTDLMLDLGIIFL